MLYLISIIGLVNMISEVRTYLGIHWYCNQLSGMHPLGSKWPPPKRHLSMPRKSDPVLYYLRRRSWSMVHSHASYSKYLELIGSKNQR